MMFMSSFHKKALAGSLAIVLAAILAFLSVPGVMVSHAVPTEESIRKKEQQIEKSKKQRDSLKANMTDLEKVKAALQKNKNDLAAYIKELDDNLAEIEEKIEDLTGQIAEKEEDIVRTQEELEEAQAVQEAQYEAMKKRIRFMYEKGETYYLALLFDIPFLRRF